MMFQLPGLPLGPALQLSLPQTLLVQQPALPTHNFFTHNVRAKAGLAAASLLSSSSFLLPKAAQHVGTLLHHLDA